MKDLTDGPISGLLVQMAIPIALGMLFQTLYLLVDLYFVAGLGDVAIAGVSSAGNASFVVLALTQMLGVGTVALVSHAAGRKDQPEANLIFNQSVLLSAVLGLATIVVGYLVTPAYAAFLAADAPSAAAGASYLFWYLPGLALQFALVAMGSALRGTGIVKPTMMVQVLTVVLNTVFAPILIAGWGTHHPMGVAGAGLASTLAIAIGVGFLWIYFHRLEKYVALHPRQWIPHPPTLRRILAVGLPAGGEFLMMFVIIVVIYWAVRHFGPATQAGVGIAYRVMQGIFLPVMALAFAASPLAGQNFGARRAVRVKETFRAAAWMSTVIMLALTLICRWRGEVLVRFFTTDAAAIAVGAEYLHILSWNFVATGLVFVCSSLFQGLGNTLPSLVSSGSRLLTYVAPAIWLGSQPQFELRHLWYLSVMSASLQAVFSLVLLQREFRLRLAPLQAEVTQAGHPRTAGGS